MTKAEEAALKAYPPKRKEVSMTGAIYTVVGGDFERRIFQEGYETAEKDLALTWEDVKEIVRIADTMMDFDPHNRPEWMESDKAYYTEVLKRFKETKQ